MGGCCSRTDNIAEDHLRNVVSHLNISEMKYETVSKEILELATKDEINKKTAEQYLKNLILEPNKKAANNINSQKLKKIQQKIFNFLTNTTKPKINVHELLFKLFPYCIPDSDNQLNASNLFSLVFHLTNRETQVKKVEAVFKQYIENVTETLNHIIFSEQENGEINERLSKLMSEVYTQEHILIATKDYMKELKKQEIDSSIVTVNEFNKHFKELSFADYKDIRNYFLINFESK